jgi:hypothetical protein
MFVCLSVCLFFMHLVPLIASVTKLSKAPLWAQRRAERGPTRLRRWGREVWVKFHLILMNCKFLVPVIPGGIQISTAYPLAQKNVDMGTARPRGGGNWMKFHPALINSSFHRFFRNFGKLPTIFRVFIYYYLIALSVGVEHESRHE